MLHLSSERLAELADGEPTAAEAEHLAACGVCAVERDAHRRVLDLAAGERGRIAPPLTNWPVLSARLRDEGIITSTVPRRGREAWRAGLRVAAGLVLVVGGAAFGRMSAGADVVPSGSEIASLAREVIPSDVADQPFDLDGGGAAAQFGSVDEALALLAKAQRDYDRAASFIAAYDSTPHSPEATNVFRARLAALDVMAEASRQALYEAPADPVLNQYYISTLGAREVTLRQLGTALPDGKRLSRF